MATPLYLFVGICMLLSAATELGTTQRIESLLAATGVNALLLLAFINGIMIFRRALAGPISVKMSTAGMLWFSAIFSFIGLQLLAGASGSSPLQYSPSASRSSGRRRLRSFRRICRRAAPSVFR